MMINQRKLTAQKKICSCKLACVSMPMLLDLILVKHFSPHFLLRRVRKRRSTAALAMYMVMYKVKCTDVVCAGPDPG